MALVPAHTRFTGHKGSVYALCPTASPGSFLSASGDGSVVRWILKDPENGITEARVNRAIFALHRANEQLLYIGDEDGGLHLVGLAERRELQLERAHVKGIFAIEELPDGRLAVAGGDGAISIWPTGGDGRGGGRPRRPLRRHVRPTGGQARSPVNNRPRPPRHT